MRLPWLSLIYTIKMIYILYINEGQPGQVCLPSETTSLRCLEVAGLEVAGVAGRCGEVTRMCSESWAFLADDYVLSHNPNKERARQE